MIRLLCSVVLVLCWADTVRAQVAQRDLVVDRVHLKTGPQLRGILVSERPLRFLVRSTWLEEAAGEFFESELKPLLEGEFRGRQAALRELIGRELGQVSVPAVAVAGSQESLRRGLLQDLFERLEAEDVQPGAEWLVLEIPRVRVQRLDEVSARRRELGRLGMLNRVSGLEELSWMDVEGKLSAIPESQRLLVFGGIVGGEPEPVERVFERILAAADVRSGGASRVVRSGAVCVDEASPGGVATLFGQALQQGFEGTLKELLDEASGLGGVAAGAGAGARAGAATGVPAEAVAIANRAGRRTLVISTSRTDLSTGTAVVERALYFRGVGAEWRLQLLAVGQAGAGDVPAGGAGQLANDPQVRELAGVAEALGLGGGELQQALGMGAVVQQALARAESRFGEQLQNVLTGRAEGIERVPVLVVAAKGVSGN